MGILSAFFKAPQETAIKPRELYNIYTDNHIGVPMQKCPELETMLAELVTQQNAISLGDNFELKNCEKKDLPRLIKSYQEHKQKFAGRFVSGNHDCQGYSNDYTLTINGILFAHGDIILWGNKKAFDFRSNKMGGGFSFINKIALNRNGSISNSEAKELSAYAKKYNAHTIVIGHVHPAKIFDQNIDGVRVVCCPRGKTSIYL
jgi:metallophosphoesterase superfamily enzyme